MKTLVYIVKGKRQGQRRKPGLINGDLAKRGIGVTKALVYHFTAEGDLLVDLIPVRFIQPAVFELEGLEPCE